MEMNQLFFFLNLLNMFNYIGVTDITDIIYIANFKFSHTFIRCDRLPETDILVGIDI